MSALSSVSIRNKLAGISLLVSALALGGGFTFVMINDIRTFREDVLSNTVATARLIAENAVPTLAFADEQGATEVLAKLQAIPSIVAASVHDGNGRLFATYGDWGPSGVPQRLDAEMKTGFEGPVLRVVDPIVYRGRAYGTIYLRASTAALDAKIGRYQLTMLLVLGALAVSSFLLARVLQKAISGRILTLADVAGKITRTRDYSVRVSPKGDDEIDALYRAFNDMLEEINATETQRDEAIGALRTMNVELEERVAERTAELQARNRELETFTYSVSHDLKAPLRGLDGYSRLLLEGHADRLDEEGRSFLQTIRRSAQQMGQLIDDLLAYSKLERRAFQPGLLDLRALVESLLAERADEVSAQGVTVAVDVPAGTVTADHDGLAQAVRNLLDNALKFTRGARAPAIAIGGHETPTAHVLWVRDNGVGFEMRFHDRIFEIFQRLQRQEDYPGTGIGLAIVKKALERMGGRVWAESTPGNGATFWLEIPK